MKEEIDNRNGNGPLSDRQVFAETFLTPRNNDTEIVLRKYMDQILFGLQDFLKKHVGITHKIPLEDLSCRFSDTLINKNPEKKLEQVFTELIEDIAPHAVNVASPYFVGHMTAAIPFFMVHLKTVVAALNQNVVKLETSRVASLVEKQVLAKIHRMIYCENETFYNTHIQNAHTALGAFTSDGTTANLTALWVARNALFAPKPGFAGVEKEGITAAYRFYGIDRAVILVSRLGHYSLNKAGGILGIGNRNVIPVAVDSNNRMDIDALCQTIQAIKGSNGRTQILAIVGIAGATETGTIDPLRKLGEICDLHNVHFHVDAAWGGPTLMSEKYRHLLDGVKHADSVSIDGHKQFYLPMSCGMVYFKNPFIMDTVAYHADYINRLGSADLGIKSIAGSREATSLILDSALKIMGTDTYARLIDHGIETAGQFAQEIQKRPLFQLITIPELNILTYRICPTQVQRKLASGGIEEKNAINKGLNEINRVVQRLQRKAGRSFVSRTLIKMGATQEKEDIVVFRAVIMNPMTTIGILREVLDEQEEIYRRTFTSPIALYEFGRRIENNLFIISELNCFRYVNGDILHVRPGRFLHRDRIPSPGASSAIFELDNYLN
jgi:glutamate decarboxylase